MSSDDHIPNIISDIEFWQDEALSIYLESQYTGNNKESQLKNINSDIDALREKKEMLQKRLQHRQKQKELESEKRDNLLEVLLTSNHKISQVDEEINFIESEIINKKAFMNDMQNPEKAASHVISKLSFSELQVYSAPLINYCMNMSHFYIQQQQSLAYKKLQEDYYASMKLNQPNSTQSADQDN